MKETEIKKKHHYVWAHYLKGWANDGINIWYLSKKGNPSFDSVKGIGCENHFYRVGLISENDIHLMNLWIKDCSPELRSTHLELINFVRHAQHVARVFENVPQHEMGFDFNEVLSSNLYENFMAAQEYDATKVIKKLREGDISCFDDESSYRSFSYFLGHQFSRTKRMRDSILYSVEQLKCDENIKSLWRGFYGRHWWFMCSFLGTNLSKDIAINSKRKIKIIENLSDIPFITSDQPVINLNPDGMGGTEIDYYYPLSDKRALLILNSGNVDFKDSITDDSIIDFLNSKIASFAGDTIYSTKKETILAYKKAFNQRQYKF